MDLFLLIRDKKEFVYVGGKQLIAIREKVIRGQVALEEGAKEGMKTFPLGGP